MKVKLSVLSFGLLALCAVNAEATLQMHIFDEPNPNDQLSAAEAKPVIEMHVFDRSEALQNNAVVPEYQARPHPRKKELLTYDKTELTVKSGYRRDDIDWSIAGLNNWPGSSAIINWRDIEVATLGTSATIYTQANWLVSFEADYGRVLSGSTQASNYTFSRGELLEYSRSNYDADNGHTVDVSAAVGYENVLLWGNSLYPSARLTPLFGFSYHTQNLQKSSGIQTRSEAISLPAVGETLEDNKNSYNATWYGPWIGLDSQFLFNQRFKLDLDLAYHHAFYDADAHLNSEFRLEDQPKQFTQESRGYGLVGRLNGQLSLHKNLSLNLGVNYQYWQANRHNQQRAYSVNNIPSASIINEVSWKSFGANIGLAYEF